MERKESLEEGTGHSVGRSISAASSIGLESLQKMAPTQVPDSHYKLITIPPEALKPGNISSHMNNLAVDLRNVNPILPQTVQSVNSQPLQLLTIQTASLPNVPVSTTVTNKSLTLIPSLQTSAQPVDFASGSKSITIERPLITDSTNNILNKHILHMSPDELINTIMKQCDMGSDTNHVISLNPDALDQEVAGSAEKQKDIIKSTEIATHGLICLQCGFLHSSESSVNCHNSQLELAHIQDAPIPSRARQSLPAQLNFTVSDADHSKIIGICTKFDGPWLQKGVQFDPLQGILVAIEGSEFEHHSESPVPQLWKVFEESHKNAKYMLDCREENNTNWLVFMQAANSTSEQNVTVFQVDKSLVFVTSRDIPPGTELKFWYSSQYSQLLGVPTNPDQTFECQECGKKFAVKSALSRHQLYQHSKQKNRHWACNFCDKAFASAVKLRTHSLKHTGEKPFICHICHKTFTDKSNLRMHASIHTGERKFKCSLCAATFRQKAHLTSHMLVHSKNKSHSCEFCDRAFARVSDLKVHRYSHTKEKVYTCPRKDCGKIFHRLQTLKRHETVHSGEKKHSCDICGKSFAAKYHVTRHVRVCHGPKSKKKEGA